MTEHPAEPKLAPPGAGLPFPKNLVARYLLKPILSRRMSWEASDQQFERETQKILALCKDLDESSMTKRVLVPSLPGLEDSSRYWSIAMTLEHLVIVQPQIAQLISALSQGQVPDVVVSTANVKPKGGFSAKEMLAQFAREMTAAQATLKSGVTDRKNPARLAHPWFGGMNAHEWHWLFGTHPAIHRTQIKWILRRSDL